jgi:hypothetical protein
MTLAECFRAAALLIEKTDHARCFFRLYAPSSLGQRADANPIAYCVAGAINEVCHETWYTHRQDVLEGLGFTSDDNLFTWNDRVAVKKTAIARLRKQAAILEAKYVFSSS